MRWKEEKEEAKAKRRSIVQIISKLWGFAGLGDNGPAHTHTHTRQRAVVPVVRPSLATKVDVSPGIVFPPFHLAAFTIITDWFWGGKNPTISYPWEHLHTHTQKRRTKHFGGELVLQPASQSVSSIPKGQWQMALVCCCTAALLLMFSFSQLFSSVCSLTLLYHLELYFSCIV